MTSPFGAYSRYYDLLYQDKDYAGEAEYICSLMTKFTDGASDILELGCGTGKHARILSQLGFNVTGIDRSEEMIWEAQSAQTAHPRAAQSGIAEFQVADAKTIRLCDHYDCVLSLFHVVSYQTSNDDVGAILATAAAHLNPNGALIFDIWYGPAVLTQTPTVRTKRMKDDHCEILRIAEPTIDTNRNIVFVDYTIFVTNNADKMIQKIHETHSMRYFFLPELAMLATANSMKLLHCEQWMTGGAPSPDTWGVTVVMQKNPL